MVVKYWEKGLLSPNPDAKTALDYAKEKYPKDQEKYEKYKEDLREVTRQKQLQQTQETKV